MVQGLAGSPYVGPQKSTSWIRLPWLSDTDSHNSSLVSNSPGPKNQHPGSARLGFPTRIRIRGHSQQGWHVSIKNKSALVGNRWRSPPASSDTDPDPWSLLQAPLDPRAFFFPGLALQKKKVEGVTKDLDPVRKHLEESSRQFRQGLTCFF